jgi:hypothetical protein
MKNSQLSQLPLLLHTQQGHEPVQTSSVNHLLGGNDKLIQQYFILYKGYHREPTQELWICFLSHAYDKESDSSDILLRK